MAILASKAYKYLHLGKLLHKWNFQVKTQKNLLTYEFKISEKYLSSLFKVNSCDNALKYKEFPDSFRLLKSKLE